jgi:hypothetical protein
MQRVPLRARAEAEQQISCSTSQTIIFKLFMLTRRDYVSELLPPTGLLSIPPVIYKNGQPWLNDNGREKPEERWEEPDPVPLNPLQIPHGLTWARIMPSAVRGRRLTAWAMVWPYCMSLFHRCAETHCMTSSRICFVGLQIHTAPKPKISTTC